MLHYQGPAPLVVFCAVRGVAGTPLGGFPLFTSVPAGPPPLQSPPRARPLTPTGATGSDKGVNACSTKAHPRTTTDRPPPRPRAWPRASCRRKPVERLVAEGGQGEGRHPPPLLGLWQLTMISIGATLGTGIFVVLGEAVPKAGPAVTLSFVIAGLTALFSALSYAELAGTIPVAGSSYSYAYATMGELVAWICGWCLVLEYGVSVAAVAVGWGEYLNELLDGTIGVTIPAALSAPPGLTAASSTCPR